MHGPHSGDHVPAAYLVIALHCICTSLLVSSQGSTSDTGARGGAPGVGSVWGREPGPSF